jgi:hypothetical protein
VPTQIKTTSSPPTNSRLWREKKAKRTVAAPVDLREGADRVDLLKVAAPAVHLAATVARARASALREARVARVTALVLRAE